MIRSAAHIVVQGAENVVCVYEYRGRPSEERDPEIQERDRCHKAEDKMARYFDNQVREGVLVIVGSELGMEKSYEAVTKSDCCVKEREQD